MKQWFSTWATPTQQIPSNEWRHLRVVTAEEVLLAELEWGEARGAAKHPTAFRAFPHQRRRIMWPQNVRSAELETPPPSLYSSHYGF